MNALNHLIATATFWMPRQGSDVAAELDNVFYFIYYLSVIFFVGIIAAMVYFSVKYHRKSEDQRTSPLSHSNTLEFWWTIIPAVLLAVMFFWGIQGMGHDQRSSRQRHGDPSACVEMGMGVHLQHTQRHIHVAGSLRSRKTTCETRHDFQRRDPQLLSP